MVFQIRASQIQLMWSYCQFMCLY